MRSVPKSWVVIFTKDLPKWNLQSPIYLKPAKKLSIFNFSVNKGMSFPLSILWGCLKKNRHEQINLLFTQRPLFTQRSLCSLWNVVSPLRSISSNWSGAEILLFIEIKMIRHRIKILIQDFIVFEIIFQNSNYFILMNSLFQDESSLPQNLKKKTRTWKRFGCLLLFCLVLLPRLI